MRLIDVDKIIITRQEYVGALTLKERLRRLLESQPTVEAIPVEWIKDYVGSGVSDDIFQRNRRFVLNMIKDWEKENEPQSRNN